MITKDFDTWVPFIGIVEDLNDPEQLDRVKIRVFNKDDDDVETRDLNWATPIVPNSASKQGIGTSGQFLEKGSMVIGFFLDGHSRTLPMILGSFAKVPGGDKDKHDVHKRARGVNEIKDKQVGPEPAQAYAGKYPNVKVHSTRTGHLLELDDTPGQERIYVRHKSGSYVEINKDGRVVVKSVDNMYTIAAKDSSTYTKGKANIESKGDITIITKGKCSIVADGECKVTSKAKISLKAPVVDLMSST